jgi:DNA-binding transcriptional MerR regulator
MDSDRIFTLQALRREFGVTSRTLRYYEEQGLLSPERLGDQRIYSPQDRLRLRLVLICRRAGMSLSDVRGLVSVCLPPDEGFAEAMRELAAFHALIAALAQRRRELESMISELEHMREETPAARKGPAGEGACTILKFPPRPGRATDP